MRILIKTHRVNFMNYLTNLLKKDFQISSKGKEILLECITIGLLIFLGIFWKWFNLVALIVSAVFILIDRSGKSSYFLFFLFPLIYIFRVKVNETYYLSYLSAFLVLVLSIEILKKLKNKTTKLNIPLTIILGVLSLYVLIFSVKKDTHTMLLSFLLGSILIYVLSYFKEDLDFKESSFAFLLGIVFSIFIGCFWKINSRLQEFIPMYYVNGFSRLTGASLNTNVFALDLVVLFSLFIALFAQKRISLVFYPVFMVISFLIPMLLGKSSFIVYLVLLVVTIVTIIARKDKFWWVGLIFVAITIVLMFLLEFKRMVILLDRLNIKIGNIEIVDGNIEVANPGNNKTSSSAPNLDYLTTGRFDIIKTYLSNMINIPMSLILGNGLDFSYLTICGGSSNGFVMGPHSAYIECVYSLGLIGTILLLVYVVFLMRNFNKKMFSIPFAITLLPVLLFATSLSFFGYRLFTYLLLSLICLKPVSCSNTSSCTTSDLNQGEKNMKEKNDEITLKKLAVLTPAYNRETLLARCFESLKKQTNKNFKWYVVDDGSTDGTEKVVKDFAKHKDNGFEIQYIKKENGGKHTALNVGLKEICEKYVTILDSDDQFTENAVEEIMKDIPLIDDNPKICGLGYLRVEPNLNVIGRKYTEDGIVESFIEQRYNRNTYGDKCEVFKTDILKQYPFPEIEGERFLSESTVWCKMSGPFKMMFFNKGLYICEYQPNGLSDGVHKRLFKNPKGAALCYKEMSQKDFIFKLRVKYTIAYIVYSLAAGYSFKQIKQNHPDNKFLIGLLYLPSKLYYKKQSQKYSAK